MRKPLDWLHRRALGPLLAGSAGVAACVLQALIFGVPVPAIHDEFSYLLAADTFCHGRCTNLQHPLWQHFETIHVLQRPTYASKYPPGQGLFLAAGWLIGGHPVVGVWLGMGLACAAAAWMLQAFVPRGRALVGGLLMASWLGFSEWGWCYMGGGVAAAGGCLFIGGWARVLRRPAWFPAVLMAIGLSLLAISRPFEGFLLCLPTGLATAAWLARRRPSFTVIVRQVLAPALAILVPAALALGHYNRQVTGSYFRLPYLEHAAQYDAAPVLLVQGAYPLPYYRHQAIREFHVENELADYRKGRTFDGWVQRSRGKLLLLWSTYLGWALALPLIALPAVLTRSPRTRFALAACAVVFGTVIAVETWGLPHYAAPVAGLVYLVVVQCFRRIALYRSWQPARRRLVATWVAVCVLVPAASLSSPLFAAALERASPSLPTWLSEEFQALLLHRSRWGWAVSRSEFEQEMRRAGGRHLVIVRYVPGHSVHEEWINNEADIDAAPVVWARDMGPAEQVRLLDYFKDRTVWLVEVSAGGWRRARLRGPLPATHR